MSPFSRKPLEPDERVVVFAGNLAKQYAQNGGDLAELFAAYVAVVCLRDERVGHDCLEAIDLWISGVASAGRREPSA